MSEKNPNLDDAEERARWLEVQFTHYGEHKSTCERRISEEWERSTGRVEIEKSPPCTCGFSDEAARLMAWQRGQFLGGKGS